MAGAAGLELLSCSCYVRAVRGLDCKSLRCWEERTSGLLASEQGLVPAPFAAPLLLCPTFSPVGRDGGHLPRIDEGAQKTRPPTCLRPSWDGNRFHDLLLTGSCFSRVVPFQARRESSQLGECEAAGCETPESIKTKVRTQLSGGNAASWKEKKMEQQRCSKLSRGNNGAAGRLMTFK